MVEMEQKIPDTLHEDLHIFMSYRDWSLYLSECVLLEVRAGDLNLKLEDDLVYI